MNQGKINNQINLKKPKHAWKLSKELAEACGCWVGLS